MKPGWSGFNFDRPASFYEIYLQYDNKLWFDLIRTASEEKSEAASLCWSTSRGASTLQVRFAFSALQQSKLEKWSVTWSVTWSIPWSAIVDRPYWLLSLGTTLHLWAVLWLWVPVV
jgi:hypothetical protein